MKVKQLEICIINDNVSYHYGYYDTIDDTINATVGLQTEIENYGKEYTYLEICISTDQDELPYRYGYYKTIQDLGKALFDLKETES